MVSGGTQLSEGRSVPEVPEFDPQSQFSEKRQVVIGTQGQGRPKSDPWLRLDDGIVEATEPAKPPHHHERDAEGSRQHDHYTEH